MHEWMLPAVQPVQSYKRSSSLAGCAWSREMCTEETCLCRRGSLLPCSTCRGCGPQQLRSCRICIAASARIPHPEARTFAPSRGRR